MTTTAHGDSSDAMLQLDAHTAVMGHPGGVRNVIDDALRHLTGPTPTTASAVLLIDPTGVHARWLDRGATATRYVPDTWARFRQAIREVLVDVQTRINDQVFGPSGVVVVTSLPFDALGGDARNGALDDLTLLLRQGRQVGTTVVLGLPGAQDTETHRPGHTDLVDLCGELVLMHDATSGLIPLGGSGNFQSVTVEPVG